MLRINALWGMCYIGHLLIINICMVWDKRLQFNGAWHVSSILLVWPQREGFSEASLPSTSALWLYWKTAFVEKNKLSNEQMRRTKNRSSSQGGKLIRHHQMHLLLINQLKADHHVPVGEKESHTSVSVNGFCLSQLLILFQLYNPLTCPHTAG